MKLWKTALIGGAALAWISFGSWSARGQEPDTTTPTTPPASAPPSTTPPPTNPKPAAHSYGGVLDDNDANPDDQNATQLQPDTRPLTGVETPTLGTQEFRHSFLVPGIQYANTIQSANLDSATPGWSSNNYLVGTLSLQQNWVHSQLSLNYSGGRFFSTDSALGNGNFQQLGVVQAFNWGRLQVQLLDQFSYLPETEFGFGGVTDLAVAGSGSTLSPALPSLGSNITPSQNIFGTLGPRYSNAFATQATYTVTPRGSITLAGAYGLLHFVNVSNSDTDNEIGSIGYNYDLTRESTIGVLYRFTAYHYESNPQAFGDHLVNILYGRKITGRLAMQLAIGPEIAVLRVPVNGENTRDLWSGLASLTYGVRNGSVTLSYFHGVSGGSGILLGSNADQLTLSAERQLNRQWRVLGSFGYARNRNLAATNLPNSQQSFNSYFVTAGVVRPLGPNASFAVSYTARIQDASTAVTCPFGVCGANYTQHQIALGFAWNAHPIVIR